MKKTKAKKTSDRRPKHAALRKMLLKRRAELIEQMTGQLAGSRPDSLGARFGDIADMAADSFYDELAQGFAEIASADLKRIERSLVKIDKGTYGTCEGCGSPIPPARLRLLPFAELCVKCQREEEEATGREWPSIATPRAPD